MPRQDSPEFTKDQNGKLRKLVDSLIKGTNEHFKNMKNDTAETAESHEQQQQNHGASENNENNTDIPKETRDFLEGRQGTKNDDPPPPPLTPP